MQRAFSDMTDEELRRVSADGLSRADSSLTNGRWAREELHRRLNAPDRPTIPIAGETRIDSGELRLSEEERGVERERQLKAKLGAAQGSASLRSSRGKTTR